MLLKKKKKKKRKKKKKKTKKKKKKKKKGFPGCSDDKESAFNLGACVGKIPPEKGMVTHSSILAWRIPRTEEPGGLN